MTWSDDWQRARRAGIGLPAAMVRLGSCLLVASLVIGLSPSGRAAAEDVANSVNPYGTLPVFDALTAEQWRRVDASVNRGLAWLAHRQQPDGAFPTLVGGQPAIY